MRTADACVNATMSDDTAIETLREAEQALEIGDVARAHRLAREVRVDRDTELYVQLYVRAVRLDALASVRDPKASPADLKQAIEDLETEVKGLATTKRSSDPALEADLGEALERAGRNEDALRVLGPLAEKDLIGSSYAYAALSRAAKAQHDDALASSAHGRCVTYATSARICDGVYPRPSWLWTKLTGKARGYFASGLVLLGALVLRRVLVRRKKRALGDAFLAVEAFTDRSWRRHATPIAIAALGALLLFGIESTSAMIFVAAAAALVALRAGLGIGTFVRAVEADSPRTRGFTLRPTLPEDERLPLVKLFFLREAATIERTEDATYREGARTALVRVAPRPGKLFVALVFGGTALILTIAVFATFATLLRGSRAADEARPVELSLPKSQAP